MSWERPIETFGAPRNVVLATRGAEVESVHQVHGIVVGSGDEEAQFGDSELLAFWRSAMKPFQALPLVRDHVDEAFEFGPAELALCCASHDGAPSHVSGVASMLARLGLFSGQLECGPQPPHDRTAAEAVLRAGGEFTALHNNCSGKHAGMLALALQHGWPTAGYSGREHPVQGRIRQELTSWLDVDPEILRWAVDGCGVPTPFLSLRQMARAYARLGRAASDADPAAAAVVSAMTSHPELVSGDRNLSTRLMRDTGGRLVAKEGAEGVFCVCEPKEGWGLAVKVGDGTTRAVAPAVLEMLTALNLLDENEADRLADLRKPFLHNWQDKKVGTLHAEVNPRLVPVTLRL